MPDGENQYEIIFLTILQKKYNEFDDIFYTKVNELYESLDLDDWVHGKSDKSTRDINSPITTHAVQETIKSYKSEGKSFDNLGFHPSMLKKLGPNCG